MIDRVDQQSIYLRRLRAVIAALYILMAVGLIAELLITEHSEDFWQALPIGLAGAGIVALILSAIFPVRFLFWSLQLVLVLQILSAGAGVYFHHKVREEFQLEAYPDLSGWALFKEAFSQRNPPPLAPGAMALTGLLGLAWSYRHPALARRRAPGFDLTESSGGKPPHAIET